jgi:serine/threonine-protein kinase RsbT
MLHDTNAWPAECSRVERVRVPVTSDRDVLQARLRARELASEADFTTLESTMIATTVSELGRNILQYAARGEIMLRSIQQENRTGVMVVARDNGPGICDLERALQDGVSSNGGLGLGLPGVRRMMDEFEIESHQNLGTTVTVKKWAQRSTTGGLGRTSIASFKSRDGAAAGKLAAVGSVTR